MFRDVVRSSGYTSSVSTTTNSAPTAIPSASGGGFCRHQPEPPGVPASPTSPCTDAAPPASLWSLSDQFVVRRERLSRCPRPAAIPPSQSGRPGSRPLCLPRHHRVGHRTSRYAAHRPRSGEAKGDNRPVHRPDALTTNAPGGPKATPRLRRPGLPRGPRRPGSPGNEHRCKAFWLLSVRPGRTCPGRRPSPMSSPCTTTCDLTRQQRRPLGSSGRRCRVHGPGESAR